MIRVHILKKINCNTSLIDINITASDVGAMPASSVSTDPNTISAVTCLTSVLIGNVVRLSSGVARNAQADTFSNSNWVGVVIEKPGDTCCTIRMPSFTSSVYSTLNEGALYFLSDSTAGSITTVHPTAHNAVLAPVGIAYNSQRLSIVNMQRTIRRT